VNHPEPIESPLPPAPGEALRVRLESLIGVLTASGQAAHAGELRAALDAWSDDQRRWEERLSQLLGVHHEINNALVGVRGNAQLLLMDPAVQSPGVRERLDTVLRESGRIRDAAARLRELKATIHGTGSSSRAA
jgi:signal transduction histidine kinase